jgi:hypothetical protein
MAAENLPDSGDSVTGARREGMIGELVEEVEGL